MKNVFTALRESSLIRFLIPTGIILIIFGILFLQITNKNKDYIKTEATVTKAELYEKAHDEDDIHYDDTYVIYVKYKVNNKNYEEQLGILSGYKKGDKITIAYNPNDPKIISQPGSKTFSVLSITGGIIALTVGTILLIVKTSEIKKIKEEAEKKRLEEENKEPQVYFL